MDVVGGILRQVEVEDMADIGDMQAARGDIGRDQHRKLAFVKFFHVAQALLLRHIARKRRRVDAVGTQHILEPLRHTLGVDEHHGAMRSHLTQQSDEQGDLLLHRRVVHELTYPVGGDFLGLDPHQFRFVHVLVGELEHALRERR